MSEESRRELIARQHRALWGSESPYPGNGAEGTGSSARGASPFAAGNDPSASQSTAGGQSPPPANTASSPSSGTQPNSFGLIDTTAQKSSQTSTSSPGGDSPSHQNSVKGPIGSGMGPIGSRPAHQQGPNALNKRSTTPLPSPLSYGFAHNEGANNERSNSAASNPSAKESNVGLGWGSGSGVWGSKSSLGVQASVWG